MTADAYATVFMLADTITTRQLAQQENLSYMLIMSDENEDFHFVYSRDFNNFVLTK